MSQSVARLARGMSAAVLLTISCGEAGPAGEGSESPEGGSTSESVASAPVRLSAGTATRERVTHLDTLIWDDISKKRRGVRVTVAIPANRDSVVIERMEGDSNRLEFHQVNQARVLVPAMLPRVTISSADKAGSEVILSVRLERCAKLVLTVREYLAGNVLRHTLRQKGRLPTCCSDPVPTASALEESASGFGEQGQRNW